jgi:transcription initiation factor TFIIB
MEVPRRLEEITEAANADYVFAGRSFRIMARELKISPSVVDSTRYISKVAVNADVSQRTCRTAQSILKAVKRDTISYGKDPSALTSAALYCACLLDEVNISQTRIARAADISVVTLRKRVSDVLKLFPEIGIKK